MIWVQGLNDRLDHAEMQRLLAEGWTVERDNQPDCTIWRWTPPKEKE